MKQLTVGLAVTLSGRWPRELPEKRLAEYTAWAQENLPQVDWVLFDHVLSTPQEVTDAIEEMKRRAVDVVLMVYGAFTGDDIPAALAQKLGVPIILWAPYEPPYEREERLFANALCSLTMNAASLGRLGYPCHGVYGGHEDARAAGKVLSLLGGYGVKKAMAHATLGLFGYRPTNYYVSTFDEALIRRTFGVSMNETDLKVVFDEMAALPEDEVKADMEKVAAGYDPSQLPQGHLENHSRLYLALKKQMKAQGYDYGCIKCWPEMGHLHTTPCAVLGRLTDEGINIGCEGDVDAELTQMMQTMLTGLPTFITDMIDMDEERNTLTFWHCGNAAPSLHNEKYAPEIRNHPLAGQGTAFWTSLRPGVVTIARLHNFHGQYRLALLQGEATDEDRNTRGSMVRVKVQTPVREIADKLIENQFPHHFCIVWSDCLQALKQTARLMNIDAVEL